MNLIDYYVYRGRNIYSHSPVIRLMVDLGEWYNTPSNEIPGFTEKLLGYLPGMSKHKCSLGYEGGFVKRLEEGTYLAHIIEHTTLELQSMMGHNVKYGKARQTNNESVYCIVYAYKDEVAGLACGKLAISLLLSILAGESFSLDAALQQITKSCAKSSIGSSTAAIIEAAKKREIPVIRIGESSLLQLGYGKNQRRIQATLSENANCISVDTACDKLLTKELLSEYGIPVPLGSVVHSLEEALAASTQLGFPVVLKPNSGNQGKGVSVNLKNQNEVISAYHIALQYENTVMVEKFIKGNHYRLLVVGDKVAAASERIPAHVIGDGIHKVSELIDIENNNPLRGNGHIKPLTKIVVDDVVKQHLNKQNINMEDIPGFEQIVYLRENDNLSTGGIAVDVTEDVHPDNQAFAVRAAQIIGLDIAGIDITTPDITRSITEQGGAIIEVNAAPGIRMHHYPAKGTPRNVAGAIVDMLCPDPIDYTIPIVSITGTNGKTTTTRMIGHIIREQGYRVGMSTTSGVYLGETCINKGDNTGPQSAKTILMDKSVEYAVLETARGGIVRRGLGYNLADVGIVTNITEDHLGLDYVDTLEDLAHVKSLVVEAVKKNGYAVLNADDPYCVKMIENVWANIILFSGNQANPTLVEHMAQGGIGVYADEEHIWLADKGTHMQIIRIADIPLTMEGYLKYNVENCLAVVAGAFGIGMPLDAIRHGLSTFQGDSQNNPGRFNLYEVNGVKVILDYGHNIDAYQKVLDALTSIKKNKLIGIVGVPGDRTDTSTLKVGQLCGNYFDRVYIKEDRDRRGRIEGDVAKILAEGCRSGCIDKNEIFVELLEDVALEKAILEAEPEDIVIVFYEEYQPLLNVIEKLSLKLIKGSGTDSIPPIPEIIEQQITA